MPGIVRPPAVSGRFYPSNAATLSNEVHRLIASALEIDPTASVSPVGILVPHAGYVYSGAVAARAWARVRNMAPDTVVLVGPDHYCRYPHVAVYARGRFGTPLGTVAVDEDLALALVSRGHPVVERPEVHEREHALEVHLPFVKHLFPQARIVPILMGYRSAENVAALQDALVRHVPGSLRKVLLVASSDLSHYYSREVAAELDSRVVRRVKEMNPDGLQADLGTGAGEACGGDALVTVLETCRRLGAGRALVLQYTDSGEVNGDTGSVVGYMAAVIENTRPIDWPNRAARASQGEPAETDEPAADTQDPAEAGVDRNARVEVHVDPEAGVEIDVDASAVAGAEVPDGADAGGQHDCGQDAGARAADNGAHDVDHDGAADLEAGAQPEIELISLPLSPRDVDYLLRLARDAVAHAARGIEYPLSAHVWPTSLRLPCGAFVTVRLGKTLRGCVGFYRPIYPLPECVIRAAQGAVLEDFRFRPVEPHEIGKLTVEISVLTPSKPAGLEDIVVGRHGLFIYRDSRRGLLLPQVAVEHRWTPLRFLAETCRKAGLPPDAWEKGASVESFEALVFSGPA